MFTVKATFQYLFTSSYQNIGYWTTPKNQCKTAYFDESTMDKRVNLGHFHYNLFQIFRVQYYKLMCT